MEKQTIQIYYTRNESKKQDYEEFYAVDGYLEGIYVLNKKGIREMIDLFHKRAKCADITIDRISFSLTPTPFNPVNMELLAIGMNHKDFK